MKKQPFNLIAMGILLLSLGLLITVNGCKKNKDEDPEPETNNNPTVITAQFISQKDNDLLESSFNDGDKESDVVMKDTTFYKMAAACPEIIVIDTSPMAHPKIMKLDYGTGCLCADGKIRKGVDSVRFEGNLSQQGSFIQVVFRDYYVDNIKIGGEKGKTNLGRTPLPQPGPPAPCNGCIVFGIKDSGTTISGTDTASFYSLKRWYWAVGESTPYDPSDDEYVVQVDSSYGLNHIGINFYGKTPTPPGGNPIPYLNKKAICRWFDRGIVDIWEANDTAIGRVDYGNGTCDSIATVTYKGQDYTIYLK